MKRNYIRLTLLFLLSSTLLHSDIIENQYDKARKSLVEIIEKEVEETRGYLGKGKLSKTTIHAMESVKRHEFIPLINRIRAYENRPLPIGYGQTI